MKVLGLLEVSVQALIVWLIFLFKTVNCVTGVRLLPYWRVVYKSRCGENANAIRTTSIGFPVYSCLDNIRAVVIVLRSFGCLSESVDNLAFSSWNTYLCAFVSLPRRSVVCRSELAIPQLAICVIITIEERMGPVAGACHVAAYAEFLLKICTNCTIVASQAIPGDYQRRNFVAVLRFQ